MQPCRFPARRLAPERLLLALFPTALAISAAAAGHPPADNASWLRRIRRDHPRLFVNHEQWRAVRRFALGPARNEYERLRRRVDRYPDRPRADSGGPPVQEPQKIGARTINMTVVRPAKTWGRQALETAFVFRMTGDRKYLEKARRMLEVSVAVYQQCCREHRSVNWYSTGRVCAITAWDWLFPALNEEQRRAIILPLLHHVDEVQPGPGKPAIRRCNRGRTCKDGFYGVANLVWFAGLAAWGDGYDDALALRLLQQGYEYNRKLFAYRKFCAGDDGGLASATTGYALGAYLWSQFNFIYTWRSAIGGALPWKYDYLADYPVWVLWNWIPARKGRPLEFGFGDAPHTTNRLPIRALYGHLTQLIALFGDSHPRQMAVAELLRRRLPKHTFTGDWPLYPFLAQPPKNPPPPLNLTDYPLHARHFERLGQIIMHSGWSADDTWCLFTCGSRVPSHKHYDENNFVIYHNGFLALDSGSRGIEKDYNLRHYYAQTVAHNCILIHRPGEPLPSYWGRRCPDPEAQFNYGGMNRTTGGVVRAFETGDQYTYVTGDATACYDRGKCRLALRQFLFIYPDLFVICDRVVSTRPEFRKVWLLHTQNEPRIEGRTLRADQGGGRLFCRTILPADARLTKIGGPGREFFANGRNWELNDLVRKRNRHPLWGAWRLEVEPGAPRAADLFLHVLQVGDRALPEMATSEPLTGKHTAGVRIHAGDRVIEVRFTTAGAPGGRIRITGRGKIRLDRPLATTVLPQSGLGWPPAEHR